VPGNVAVWSIERPLYVWLLMLACLAGGFWGIDTVGRLEDPRFPIKTALIVTSYDGASAVEVEQEVTDVIEAALQELPYLDEMTSKSVSGRSEVEVRLLEQYDDGETPQIYDELRRRVAEAATRLPPGTATPLVEDDFGDVYGMLYAVHAPGYTPGEIADMSRHISRALKALPRVAKVQTAGEPVEAMYVEIDHGRLTGLGVPLDGVFSSIAIENQVVPAGSVEYGGRRLRIAPEMAFDSVTALGELRLGLAGTTEVTRLSDVATIRREEIEAPFQIIRHDGKRVFTVGVSVVPGENVTAAGHVVEARMRSLLRELPLGVSVSPIYEQHRVVDEAIRAFLKNLLASVLTVVLTLCVFMGWRVGAVVGAVLLLTVMGTLCVMAFVGIELQRISLGALMIAMGMLVDNGIVVAEGMVTGVRRGLTAKEAAARSVQRTQWALLGATVIGIMAFGPISLSDDNSGHFLVSLFQVVGISLLLSWLLAVTVVPLLGSRLLVSGARVSEAQLYEGAVYRFYQGLLGFGVRRAWFTTWLIVAVVGLCLWSFQFVKQGFFPTTNSPLFYVDYRLPEGTDIHTTQRDVITLERALSAREGVESVTSFIGRGATRFTTIMNPEQPNSSYAQLVVRVADVRAMDGIMAELRLELMESHPQAEVQITRAEFTPSGSSKIEARISGPNRATLRALADQYLAVYLDAQLTDRKIDWRQQQLELVPRYDEARAQLAGITRFDLSQALAFATVGVRVGLFRDGDKLMPIIARAPAAERLDVEGLMDRLIWSPAQQTHIPMRQVVTDLSLSPADGTIYRRNRFRTISVLANPPAGHNPTRTFNRIRGAVEAIPLPPGYFLEWGGEYEANLQANESLTSRLPAAFGIMFLITVLMFGRLRQPLVIWLTVPMTVCGVVVGLLATDMSFTFPSFLGLLSLSGMLIKNCIVLVDEMDKRFAESGVTLDNMVMASVSRLRPVMLTAGTTIAGMSPLLRDAFFREMAVCIMSGLAFATLLTLLAVPVFYRIALGKRVEQALPQNDGSGRSLAGA